MAGREEFASILRGGWMDREQNTIVAEYKIVRLRRFSGSAKLSRISIPGKFLASWDFRLRDGYFLLET